MTTPTVIPLISNIRESENYQFLREEGLKYIEQLSSNFWTDFNVHDPGVTFMEAICYAITDLGYRTSLPMKDLLAKEGVDNSESKAPLFTARNILSNNPLTITDYRKMLVDIDGIKNAWLDIADCQEVDFFADCKKSKLRYFEFDYKIDQKKKGAQINQAIQAFIADPDNENSKQFSYSFLIKADVAGVEVTYPVEVLLPGWQLIEEGLSNYIDFMNLDTMDAISFQRIRFDNAANRWLANVYVSYTLDGKPMVFTFNNVEARGVNSLSIKESFEKAFGNITPDNSIFLYQQQIKKLLSKSIEHDINLRGLWEVLLQYDVDDRFGDLNSNLMNYKMIIETEGLVEEVSLEIIMPSWDHIYKDIKAYEPFLWSGEITGYHLYNTFSGDRTNTITTDLIVQYNYEGGTQQVNFENLIFKGISDVAKLETDFLGILNFFHGKLFQTYSITQEAICKLHQHRNLCEDFKEISSICVNEIGICADIALENSASLIKTQAQIIFEVQRYISPSIRFYSLKEMTDKEIPSEEIFNGPKLDHGFIIDEEIEASGLNEKRFIYASDIINIIQDIPGVISIKKLLLTKYDKSGNPILPSETWCLKVDPLHKAELNVGKSKLMFFKEDLPYVLSNEKFEKMLEEVEKLRTLHDRFKLINPELDFPVPEGTPLPLEDYTALRFSLPQTYGVGATGLPESVSDDRKAKAKQLSAFLTYFDQLLGNYLSQLSNLGNLFSVDKQVAAATKKTYYNLLMSEEELGVNYENPKLVPSRGAFINESTMQRMTESEDEYLDRRNRFLDHLLARFAEDFTEYALIVFSAEDDEAQQELIYDKAGFLEDYPTISSERGKAFKYKNCFENKKYTSVELWDSTNVAGLKKRASKLLGMPDYLRQDLHCPGIRDEFEIFQTGSKFKYQLKWGDVITHTSPKDFDDEEAAFFAKEKAIDLASTFDNYIFVNTGGQHTYQVKTPNSDESTPDVYLISQDFSTEAEAKAAGKVFYKKITQDFSIAASYEFQIEKNSTSYSYKLRHHNLVMLDTPLSFTNEADALEHKVKAIELITQESNYIVSPDGGNFILQIGIPDPNNAGTLLSVLCETTEQFSSVAEAENAIENKARLFRSVCMECQVFDVLIEDNAGNFTFFLKEGTNTILESTATYTSMNEVLAAKEKVIELAIEENSFTTDPLDSTATPPFVFQLGIVSRDPASGAILSNTVMAKNNVAYPTKIDALHAAALLQRKMNSDPHCQTEGMHLFEHILLRPKNEFHDDFMEVCLDKDCNLCGQEDPYSFRTSIVFPYWTRKFSQSDPKLKKRSYVNKMLRQEAPAHVHLKICWIDNKQMRLLDIHYRRWLEENAKASPDATILTGRLNALLDILGKLRNRYPEGFLHDCDDSELENTILLDKSFLGSYHSADEE